MAIGRRLGAYRRYMLARLYGASFAIVAFGIIGFFESLAWVVAGAAVLVVATTALQLSRPVSRPSTLVLADALVVLGATYLARPYPGAEATALALIMSAAVVFGSGARVRWTIVGVTVATAVIGYLNWVVREPPPWTDLAMLVNVGAAVLTVAPMVWWMTGFVATAYQYRSLFAVAMEDPQLMASIVADESTESVVVIDLDRVIVYANPAFHGTLGFDRGVLVGEPIDHHFLGDSRKRLREGVAQSAARPTETVRNLELAVSDSAGATHDLLVSMTAIPSRDRMYVLLAIRDVTEIIRMQREVVASKDRFIASVSHELRTPLTAVVAFADILLADDVEDDEERRAHLETIADQARDLTLLVEDLLVATRLDAASLNVRLETANVLAEVEAAIRAWTIHKEIRVDERSLDIEVPIDPQRFRQIMRNLVSNAVKYGGESIVIRATTSDGMVEVEVRDNGQGVPDDLVDEVFEAYERVDRTPGLTESMGLGLFVSRGIAHAMGGGLRYRHDDGWTSFVLVIPA